jgi:hypothetical protein
MLIKQESLAKSPRTQDMAEEIARIVRRGKVSGVLFGVLDSRRSQKIRDPMRGPFGIPDCATVGKN